MWHGSCPDRSVFAALVVVDEGLAEAARAQGCPGCSAALHRGDYLRKPRGGLRPLARNFGAASASAAAARVADAACSRHRSGFSASASISRR